MANEVIERDSVFQLDVYFAVPLTKRRLAAAKGWAVELGRRTHATSGDSTIVGATVAPADDGGFVCFFHIDADDESGPGYAFVHMKFEPLAVQRGVTPAKVSKMRESWTTDDLLKRLGKWLGKEPFVASTRLHGSIAGRRIRFRNPRVMLPDATILQTTSIEFSRPGLAGSGPGVRSIRLRQADASEGVEFWIETDFGIRPWSNTPWIEEAERARELVPAVLEFPL